MKQDYLEEIYQKYYNDVYLYAFSLCKNHHMAQEICSDTFFKALVSCDDTVPSIRFWLLRVCKNCFIDRWRKAKKHRLISMEDLEIPAEESDPVNQILKEEVHRSLYRAILQLPEQSREVLLLYYFQGFSGSQIAEMTGRSGGAVRTLLYRARIQLKDLLKGE